MKKIFGLVLLSAVLFSLVGCSTTQRTSSVVQKNGEICESCGGLLQGPSFGSESQN